MSTTRTITTDELDTLTHHALITALWVGVDYSTTDDDDRNPLPLDEDYDVSDVSDGARADIRNRLAAFVATYWEDVSAYLTTDDYRSTYGYARLPLLAHDYVLTCNGHGAGFWDRGLGDLGDRLTDAAHADGEWDLYVGDDGLLYGE